LAVWLPTAMANAAEPAAPDVSATTDPSDVKPPDARTGAWAQRLFEDGSQAFNLGNFALAIRKFEAAYDLTQAVELLYNIALAYAKRHAVEPELAHLRRARVLFENFANIREANGEDARDARERVTQLDGQIAAIEAAQREAEQRDRERRAAERRDAERRAREQQAATQRAAPPPSYRPGRLGVAGYVGIGGGLLLGSGLAAAGFGSLAQLQAEHAGEAVPLSLPAEREALYARRDGEARTLGFVGVGVGAALVVVGVAMVVVDARRGRATRRVAAGPFGLRVVF